MFLLVSKREPRGGFSLNGSSSSSVPFSTLGSSSFPLLLYIMNPKSDSPDEVLGVQLFGGWGLRRLVFFFSEAKK